MTCRCDRVGNRWTWQTANTYGHRHHPLGESYDASQPLTRLQHHTLERTLAKRRSMYLDLVRHPRALVLGDVPGSGVARGRRGLRVEQGREPHSEPEPESRPRMWGPGVAATNDPEAIGLPAAEITCQCVTEHGHDCGAILPADPKLVSAHLCNEHALGGGGDSKERIACLWRHCRSRPLQQQSLIRHIVSVHLGLLRWTCPGSVTITDIFRFTYTCNISRVYFPRCPVSQHSQYAIHQARLFKSPPSFIPRPSPPSRGQSSPRPPVSQRRTFPSRSL